MTTAIRIVGVDCATKASNVGLAAATFDGGGVVLESIEVGRGQVSMAAWAAPRIAPLLDLPEPVLLALDAPLGWPRPLARALYGHTAGDPLGRPEDREDRFFQRATDACVVKELGKRPLEVGANLIARTAKAALDLLAALRSHDGSLPLAWQPGPIGHSSVIEVYPAATQLARHWPPPKDEDARAGALRHLSQVMDLTQVEVSPAVTSEHAFDALVCVLAGLDFLRGDVRPLEAEPDAYRHEGWIWFRKSEHRASR